MAGCTWLQTNGGFDFTRLIFSTDIVQFPNVMVMIGVPTHGIYFGHSMPPTLPKTPKLNIYTKI
jgi:hypothetical protein